MYEIACKQQAEESERKRHRFSAAKRVFAANGLADERRIGERFDTLPAILRRRDLRNQRCLHAPRRDARFIRDSFTLLLLRRDYEGTQAHLSEIDARSLFLIAADTNTKDRRAGVHAHQSPRNDDGESILVQGNAGDLLIRIVQRKGPLGSLRWEAKDMSSAASTSNHYLTNEEAAAFLKLSPRTLEKQRVKGTGPRFRKFGRRVIYAIEDLEQWSNARIFESTASAEAAVRR